MAVGVGRQRAASLLPYIVKTLRKESLNPANQTLPSLRRMFSLYDQINIIDSVPEDQLRFKEYSETGFTINGVKYEGSLLIVENKIMSWAPKVLILGCGRHIEPVNPELRKFIRSIGMKLEAINSRNAASTYNILNEEGRMVAAALLPYGVSS
ncbi:hypothetical protein KFK09_028829 [Dendrobium nobile]|uniref:NADH dehydrogenase [ubiquinone] 1 alpha subcomplex assembly factor 3 n=1 Tax=Dendrobium nobile TaxID=94219 RepID=A0A8T3A3I7_DENNO|nr:hypothetical protein KFK09_028829 [Dendrobium nobile]